MIRFPKDKKARAHAGSGCLLIIDASVLLVLGVEVVGQVAENDEGDGRVEGHPLVGVKPDQEAGSQAGQEGEPRGEGVARGLELQLADLVAILEPLFAEAQLAKGDGHPDEDDRQAGDGNQDQVDRVRGVDAGQQGQNPAKHAHDQGDGGDAPLVGLGEDDRNRSFIA